MPARSHYKLTGEIERFDQRDNVQPRNTLVPGAEEYKKFYERHPVGEERTMWTARFLPRGRNSPLKGLHKKSRGSPNS